MALNTGVSIVDFLTSRGLKPKVGEKFPLFNERKSIYENIGLGGSLGDFRGSAEQNTALLNRLSQIERENSISISPENIYDVVNVARGTQRQEPPTAGQGQTIQEDVQGTGGVPESLQALIKKAYGEGLPSEGELAKKAIEQFTGTTSFGLEQESVGAEKEALRLKGQSEKEDFIRKIASRGLFFSGAREGGTTAIDATTLASQLGVDRKFASLIAKGIEQSTKDVLKEAQKGETEAIQTLSTLGYVLTPDGRLIQKPAEARAIGSEERAMRSEERAIGAEERAISAEQRADVRFQERGGPSAGETTAIEYDDVKRRATRKLNQSAIDSDEGYVTPEDYMTFREEVLEKSPTRLDDFDKSFSVLLKPEDAIRLGIDQSDVDPFERVQRNALMNVGKKKKETKEPGAIRKFFGNIF